MDKDQREIDFKKLEIELKKIDIEQEKLKVEKLKAKESIFRTLSIILLTLGAGIGTLIFKITTNKTLYEFLTYSLGFLFVVILMFTLYFWFLVRKAIKEIEK